MALFNYTASYSNISSYLNATTGSQDWLKIFVSPDAAGGGHFITHGIDFGASYNNGARGLVPVNAASDLSKTFLRGDGWAALWTSTAEAAATVGDTPAQQLAAKEAYLQSTLVSAYDIKQWIAQSFAANDAMRFKGTISVSNADAITTVTEGGTTNAFPTSCEVGDTYKVTGTTNRTLANQVVNSGDMLICIKDGTGNSLNTSEYWTVVQSNIEHLTTYSFNGNVHYIYTQNNNVPTTFFAPVTSGTSGQVLISGGDSTAPVWVNAATLVVAEAAKVTNPLSKGAGLSFKVQNVEQSSYDGTYTTTIALLPASTAGIGGVIIDSGINSEAYSSATNTNNDPKPTISVLNTGEIYLSKQNIINALGFTPGNAFGQVTGVVVGSSASAAANTTAATPNPYVNILDGGNAVLGGYQISGSGKISVSSAAGAAKVVISLGAADSSDYGGVKLGYSASGKNYALQLDGNGKAYVNVPWVSNIFDSSNDGLVPMSSTANKQTSNVDNVLTTSTFVLGEDAKWYKLPASAFTGTWRNIKVNGTEVLDGTVLNGKALDLVPGSHVTIAALQTNNANDGRIQISSTWRDVQIHKITTNNNNSTIGENVASISDNDPLVFENSESIFMLGEDVTVGSGASAVTKTVVKSYITWYNMDTHEYELV